MEFIELNRSFVPIAKDTEPNLSIGREWGHRIAGWLHWSDLLNHKRVVLLAEASSGKTAELQNATTGLRRRGSAAFYFTIEQLADGRIASAFDAADAAAFADWKSASESSWFFLDSVDEARLNRKRFDDALRCLARELGTALARARVIVSCRVSDWRGNADRTALLTILPIIEPQVPPPAKDPVSAFLKRIFEEDETQPKGSSKEERKEESELLIAQLVPLSADQQRILASASGVADPQCFVASIEQLGLNSLAERPGDLLELAAYWNQNRRFGSLSEMAEQTVVNKLSEMEKYRPDNTELSASKTREGAERIAAALTLGKSFTLKTPAQEPDPELAARALDPAAILTDWSQAEINALLRRGIFTIATYGRLRFHHRATQEYLAAEWLWRLLNSGCPQSSVFNLLFADRYGVQTVVPSLRAAAAWLALKAPAVRDEIIEREPMVLIQFGDPASLPKQTKEALLLKLARRHAAGNIADDSVDNRALWLFASPDLASVIRTAWRENGRADFRFDLLRMIREGRIRGCADLALGVALDQSAPDYHRIVAAFALQACDDNEGLSELAAAALSDPNALSAGLAAQLGKILFPGHLQLSELFVLIERSKAPPEYATESFGQTITDIWEACPAADRDLLIAGLADLCLQRPFVQDHQRVSSRHFELAKNLTKVARSALLQLGQAEPITTGLIRFLAVIERAGRESRGDESEEKLNTLVQREPRVQRALFWHDVAEVRTERDVTSLWDVITHDEVLWELGTADLSWLYDDLTNRAGLDDRRVTLSAIAIILRNEGSLGRKARTLRSLIAADAILREDLERILAPRTKYPAPRTVREQYRKQREAAQERARESWRRFHDDIVADPSQLCDPLRLRETKGWLPHFNLTKWLQRRTRKEPHEAPLQWRLLGEVFPMAVVAAYRHGMCQLWRLVEPEQPEQKPGAPTTTKWPTILAFAGIAIEAAWSTDWAAHLSEDEARRAALHGRLSEQGYPVWIDDLTSRYPGAIVPIVRDKFEREWLSADGIQQFLYRYSSEGIVDADVRSAVLSVVLEKEPVRLLTIDHGLRMLGRLELDDAQCSALKRTAAVRFKQQARRNIPRAIRHLALLLLVDKPEASVTLSSWLRATPANGRRNLAEQVIGGLFGVRDPILPGALKDAPVDFLETLLRLATKPSGRETTMSTRVASMPGTRGTKLRAAVTHC